jgi:8-oxo-dGTP diphosphatase
MSTERFRPYCAVYLLLIDTDNNLLMSRRFQTGFRDGEMNLPSGHVEIGEFPVDAMIREAREEINAELSSTDLQMVHTCFRAQSKTPTDKVYVDFYFISKSIQLNIKNNEPEKCDLIQWYPIDNLPSNTSDFLVQIISDVQNNITYSQIS